MTSGLLMGAAGSAQAATKCWSNGGEYPRCATAEKSSKHLRVVESVSFENKTDRRQHYTCSFTHTVSRSVEWGGSLSAAGEFKVFAVVKATVTVEVHRNVTQTAEDATAAAFDGWVAPGETIICDRTYGYVSTRVKIYQHYPNQSDYTHYQLVRTPIRLGIRVRNLH